MNVHRTVSSRRISLITGLALGIACSNATDPVAAWLSCDCPIELQRVVALSDAAVQPLVDALRNGPTPTQRSNYGIQAADEYRLARRFRDTQSGVVGAAVVLSDSAPFVSRRVDDMVADYQKRAAFALRGVGTPVARQQLHWAYLDHIAGGVVWRTDVRAVVESLDTDFPVTSVTIRNPVADIPLGGTVQLSARVRGAALVPQSVTWQSGSVPVAVVSPSGMVTRVGVGNVTLRACSVVMPLLCGVTLLGSQ
jgi:hypothetical protein